MMTTGRLRMSMLSAGAIIAAMGGSLGTGSVVMNESTTFAQQGTQAEKVTLQNMTKADRQAKVIRDGGWRTGRNGSSKRGPGWTVAQVQRRARKTRNRRANKAAHRG